jgi:hypothetical protein
MAAAYSMDLWTRVLKDADADLMSKGLPSAITYVALLSRRAAP